MKLIVSILLDGLHLHHYEILDLDSPSPDEFFHPHLPHLDQRLDDRLNVAVAQACASALVIVDTVGTTLNLESPDARRLGQAMMSSQTALLLIIESTPTVLNSLTDMRMTYERVASIRQGHDVIGVSTRVVIDKDRAGGSGRAVQLELLFGET